MSMNRRQLVESIRVLQKQQAHESAATVARFAQIQAEVRYKIGEVTDIVSKLSENVEQLGGQVEQLGDALKTHTQAQDGRLQVLMGNLEAHVNWAEIDEADLRKRVDLLAARVRRLEEGQPPAA